MAIIQAEKRIFKDGVHPERRCKFHYQQCVMQPSQKDLQKIPIRGLKCPRQSTKHRGIALDHGQPLLGWAGCSPAEGSLRKADGNRTSGTEMKKSIIPFIWGKSLAKRYQHLHPSCTIILGHREVLKLWWRAVMSQNPSRETSSSWALYLLAGP